MSQNNKYDTLSEATNELRKKGFKKEVEIKDDNHICIEDDTTFSSDEVNIEEYHRFEGMSNPADMSVVYAIKSSNGQKGILIDAYGADASTKTAEFLDQVTIDKKS